MTNDADAPGSGTPADKGPATGGTGTRRRVGVAPNPWRRGRRRPSPNFELEQATRNATHGLGLIAALFSDASHAERAYRALFPRGYRHEEVIVVMPDLIWQSLFAQDAPPEDSEARVCRYGDARVIASGRFATLLANASPGPGDAGLINALAACGVPLRLTRVCVEGIGEGRILLGVIPRNAGDALALADEWANGKGEILDG